MYSKIVQITQSLLNKDQKIININHAHKLNINHPKKTLHTLPRLICFVKFLTFVSHVFTTSSPHQINQITTSKDVITIISHETNAQRIHHNI